MPVPVNSESPVRLWVLGLALVLAFGFAWWFRRESSPLPPRLAESSPEGTNSAAIREFLNIEAQRQRIDETVWARELEALRHETIFVQLWDELRRSQDAWAVLKSFPVEKILLGTPGSARPAGHDLLTSRLQEPMQTLERAQWHQTLDQWQAQGYRLETSEWRQAEFSKEPGEAAASVFAVRWHVIQPLQQHRLALRGRIKVQWSNESSGEAFPLPQAIEVIDLEVVQRRGAVPFEWVLATEIQPAANTIFIDPLILYDLNGDGLSEIILGCRNRIHWNQGNGLFRTASISPHATNAINTAIVADFTGDGAADFLAADAGGLLLFRGNSEGQFPDPPARNQFFPQPLPNAFVLTAGDVDGDRDLDLWLAQYKLPYVEGQMPTPYYDANDGFPSFLLLNDGQGHFTDGTERSGLAAKRFRRTYSASWIDLDHDQDLDLVVVSDFAGVDLYRNDGRGQFADVTGSWTGERHLFGMAHSFGDYDRNGRTDLFVIGMDSFVADRLDHMGLGPRESALHQTMRPRMAHGNRLFLSQDNGYALTSFSDQAARTGWSWGVTSFDLDNDADLDVYVVNGHKSRASAADYESQFWRHDIYLATSEHHPALDILFRSTGAKLYGAGYSYGGFHKNRLLLNQAGQSFLEAAYLFGIASELDCRNAVSDDLDGDGQIDLLYTTFEEWPEPKQQLHIFKNQLLESGHWIGFRLRESGQGFSPCGASVTIQLAEGQQTRHFVTGDSYRSQHAHTAHFGLGSATEVIEAEIRWPNGQVQRLANPSINQYHSVVPSPLP